MDNESLSKSQVQHSEVSTMPKTYGILNTRNVAHLLTCTLCNHIYKEATTINRCNHTFCKECINLKLQTEGITCCPTCNEDLSHLRPDEFLRSDELLRSMIESFFGDSSRTDEEFETPQVTPPQIAPATSESTTLGGFPEVANRELKAHIKKKRSKKRRRRHFPSRQTKENEETYEIENVVVLVSNSAGLDESLTFEEKDIEEFSSKNELYGQKENKKFQPVWFQLVPQEDETGHVYPMLAKSYIYVMDGDQPASIINKYLMKKLNLKSEDEVKVCCFGEPLIKNLTLGNILEIWLDCVTNAPPSFFKFVKMDEKKPVMELTYKRANNHPEFPNEAIMSDQSSC